MRFLLRLELADRPGALGELATSIGAAGGDIVGLAVVDRSHGRAVDDLLVNLPAGSLTDTLVSAAVAVPGVRLESLQHWGGGRLDLNDELAFLDELAEHPGEALERLVAAAPRLFRSDWALLLDTERVLRRAGAAPKVAPATDWLPADRPKRIDPAIWPGAAAGPDLEQVAVPVPGPARASLLVGRAGGPRYRGSEVLRLAHVTAIVAALVTSAVPA